MAITTDNEKLSLINFGNVFMPSVFFEGGVIDQGQQQQFVWGYPGVLWAVNINKTAEEKLFAALSSSTALASLVSERIFPVPLPQSVSSSPSLTYERNGGGRVYALAEGYVGLENPQFEIAIYGKTLESITGTTTAVLAAVENTTAFSAANLVNQEDEWDDGAVDVPHVYAWRNNRPHIEQVPAEGWC